MKYMQLVIVVILLFYCNSNVEAFETVTSSDTPITIAMGDGGSTLTSTIIFPDRGTITGARVELDINVNTCGADSLTLTGPSGTVTLMTGVNHNAGDIYVVVDDNAFVSCDGECLSGCGSLGNPESCYPESGAMASFIGEQADATNWTLSLGTFTGDCGPWQFNSWSLMLGGVALPLFVDGFESE